MKKYFCLANATKRHKKERSRSISIHAPIIPRFGAPLDVFETICGSTAINPKISLNSEKWNCGNCLRIMNESIRLDGK